MWWHFFFFSSWWWGRTARISCPEAQSCIGQSWPVKNHFTWSTHMTRVEHLWQLGTIWFLLRSGVENMKPQPWIVQAFARNGPASLSFPLRFRGAKTKRIMVCVQDWRSRESRAGPFESPSTLGLQKLSHDLFLIHAFWVVCFYDQLWEGWKSASTVQLLAQLSSGEQILCQ